jgi:hypothetical protein
MSVFAGFIDGAYTAQSPVSSNQALVNWFVQRIETEHAPSRAELVPTPGVREFCTFSTSGGRGAIEVEGRMFVVVGTKLYEVFANTTTTERGTVAIDANPATLCTNGDGGEELFITSGGNGYTYNLSTNVLTTVLSGGILMGGFSFGSFLAFDETNRRVRISDAFDGLTWDALEFFERSAQPDNWQAMLVDPYGYVMLPGSKTGESWAPNGAASVPFELDKSSMIEEGIAAPFSLRQAGKSKVWLSTNANGGYQVMRATGFTPQRISDHALETAIASYGDVADAIGGTYESRGHAFYQLTFPRVPITWEFNFTTGKWHQRGTWISEENRYTYWRLTSQCFAFSKHLALDRETNVLYEVSDAYAVDIDDRPLRRVRRAPALTNNGGMVAFDKLGLLIETGVGVASGNDEDMTPQVMLRASDDFGRTWGPERQASAGVQGDYQRRVEWWGLGAARGRVYEVSVSAGVPWRLTQAYQTVRGSGEAA